MEYLKLLIADDEENIRNGLKCILDWEELGYKVCGEAANGKEAIQQIIDLNPDLVIQDIKMPGYTGIEVINNVKTHCQKNNIPMPSFIILSGFSEFDYAQKALNLGAKAYLLKPVDEDELLEKVKKITEEINNANKLKSTSENTNLFQTKDILNKMFNSGLVPPKNTIEHLPFFENSEQSSYQVILCNLSYFQNFNLPMFEKSIDNYFSFFNWTSIRNGNNYFIILKTNNSVAVNNSLLRTAKLNIEKTFITVGKNEKGLIGLIDSHKQAVDLDRYLFFFSDIPFISEEEVKDVNKEGNEVQLDAIIKGLIFSIETYDKKNLEELKKKIKDKTYNITESENNIRQIFIYCLVELRYRLVTKYPEREISDGETFDVVKKLLNYNNFEDLFKCFSTILDDFIENFNFNTADSVIVKVLAYVKTNYASDLKLENLGDMFNCNSAYLGKKFKKYTGLQFNAYLDNIRMEVAKDKLKNTDLKIYQISKLVGFSNTDYFFMKFKKYTGITPKEYKKQVEDEKNN